MVTLTLPVEPAATMAVKEVEENTINEVAAVPPKLTAVTLEKFVPVTVIAAPVPAEVGVKEVIVGEGGGI